MDETAVGSGDHTCACGDVQDPRRIVFVTAATGELSRLRLEDPGSGPDGHHGGVTSRLPVSRRGLIVVSLLFLAVLTTCAALAIAVLVAS